MQINSMHSVLLHTCCDCAAWQKRSTMQCASGLPGPAMAVALFTACSASTHRFRRMYTCVSAQLSLVLHFRAMQVLKNNWDIQGVLATSRTFPSVQDRNP